MKRITLLAALAVAACGSTSTTGATLYTIGGTVGAGGAGLVLTTPGEANVTIAQGQSVYTFADGLAAGTAYDVTVKTQPSGASCTVANPQGTVGLANVTNINVTCAIELP
jgi:hypothetical protein